MVPTALVRRHTLAVAAGFCGPDTPVDLDTPQGAAEVQITVKENRTAEALRG